MRARLRSFALRLLFVGGLTAISWFAGSAIASASTLGPSTGGPLLDVSPSGTAPVAATVYAVDGVTGWCGGLTGGLTGTPTAAPLPSLGVDLAGPDLSVSGGPVGASIGVGAAAATIGVAGYDVSVSTQHSGPVATPRPGHHGERTGQPGSVPAAPAPAVAPPAAPPPVADVAAPAAPADLARPLLRPTPAPPLPATAPQQDGLDPAAPLPGPAPAPPAAPVAPSASIGGHDHSGGLRGWHAVLIPRPHVAATTTALLIRAGDLPAPGHDAGLPSSSPD
ncbi:hypothetical protein [Gandjariella thermophila]|uniref:hypothetical protein n=1 Tax=Gandjariella thermophila TaxID=1931992 RepID=UPI0018648651|nr:hypothetical protein [Gandjariella thermophila]